MLIKLDYRETDLQVACVQLLSKHFKSELTIKNENLPLGDIILYDEKKGKGISNYREKNPERFSGKYKRW